MVSNGEEKLTDVAEKYASFKNGGRKKYWFWSRHALLGAGTSVEGVRRAGGLSHGRRELPDDGKVSP